MPELALEQPLRTVADISDAGLSLDDEEAHDQKIERLLDDLYYDAGLANVKLRKFMGQVATYFGGRSIAHKTAPLKDRATAKKKLTRGGARRRVKDLKDIARATLQFQDMESMYAARDYIVQQRCFTRLGWTALKNRYSRDASRGGVGPTDQGYRDIKFFLVMDISSRRRYHIVELQLNVVRTMKAKSISHPFYDIIRLADSTWTPTRPGADITVKADAVAKLGPKLLRATNECKSRGMDLAAVSKVRKMVLDNFYKPVYYRRGASRKRGIDRYELKTNQSVTLSFSDAVGQEQGLALIKCSAAAYAYYKKLNRVYRSHNRPDDIWNRR